MIWRKIRHGPQAKARFRAERLLTDKVNLRSLNHRFVIALHSPHGVVETGLCQKAPEKKAAKLANSN
jgi:hypothetical protein